MSETSTPPATQVATSPDSSAAAPEAAPADPTLNTSQSMVVGTFDNQQAQGLAGASTNAEHHAVALLNRVRLHLSTMGTHDGAFAEIKKDFVAFFGKLFHENKPTDESGDK